MHQFEPFDGWLDFYSHESDPLSPFHDVEHSQFYFDRQVYDYLAHPLWDTIGSEGLLVKIQFADYQDGFAIIELFGVWNDLLQNDWKLLVENCLDPLRIEGISRFVFIGENILNIYVDADDYYQAFQEDLEDGWMAIIGLRDHVVEELDRYGIGQYFFWSPVLRELKWRKMKPPQIISLVEESMSRMFPAPR